MKKKFEKLNQEIVVEDIYEHLKKNWKGLSKIAPSGLIGFKDYLQLLTKSSFEKTENWFYDRVLDEAYSLWNEKRKEHRYTNSLANNKKVNNLKDIYLQLKKVRDTEFHYWDEQDFLHSLSSEVEKRFNNLDSLKPKGWEEFVNKYPDIEDIKSFIIETRNDKSLSYFGGLELPIKPPFQKKISIGYVSYNNELKSISPEETLMEAIIMYSMAASKMKNSSELVKRFRDINKDFDNLTAVEIKDKFKDKFDYKYRKIEIEEEKNKADIKNILNKFIQK